MSESKKFADRATELANQAADAAGPMIIKAKDVVVDLAEKAGPYVGKAAGMAAQGVEVAAGQLDKATKGKYTGKINSVTSKIESTLDRAK